MRRLEVRFPALPNEADGPFTLFGAIQDPCSPGSLMLSPALRAQGPPSDRVIAKLLFAGDTVAYARD